MYGLGQRVTQSHHLITVSLHGTNLGFIRTHVFHRTGIGCDLRPMFNQIDLNRLDTS